MKLVRMWLGQQVTQVSQFLAKRNHLLVLRQQLQSISPGVISETRSLCREGAGFQVALLPLPQPDLRSLIWALSRFLTLERGVATSPYLRCQLATMSWCL